MKPVLITLRPLDQKAGSRVDVRVADGPSADTYGTAGLLWEPAITSRPKLSIELMSTEMDGRVQAGQATFELALGQINSFPRAATMYWKGASVVIHSTGVLEGPTAIPDFWGYVTSARLDLDTGRLSLTAEVSTALIDKPLLVGEFTGGGGINGDAAKRGVLYPAGFGTVKNIMPVWFDTTRNIGMIDGYANTISIDWLGEGLSSFGPRVADYATYAALAAAIDNKTIKPGQWGTCVAQGLVGLGAPPTGVITVHAAFGSNRVGALMERIIITHAAVPAARVDAAAFDALDALVPVPVHYWTDQQRNVKDLLEALAQSCNATPLVTFQNNVSVTRAIGGAVVATLDRSGGVEPRVIDWQFADVDAPYYLMKARAARPASTLSDDQVNYVDTLEDKGVYAAATVYRAGALVWLADGSQWLYQNSTPSAGHAPPSTAAPDANGFVQDAWWFRRQPPKKATDFTYNDGTTLEALKPRQVGADPTSGNTAAAITSQGAFATVNTVGYGSSLLTGFGGLAPLGSVYFGSPYILEQSGGLQATLTAFKTLLGIAASITGQGAFATVSTAAYGSSLLTGFAALAARAKLALGDGYVFRADGTTSLTDALAITALGTASGISGQGALATLNSLQNGGSYLLGFGALSSANYAVFGNGTILDQGGSTATDSGFKTSLGIASAITGQAAWATLTGQPTSKLNFLVSDGTMRLGAGSGLLNQAGDAWLTNATVLTTLGTAAAIAGQGYGATAPQANVDNNYVATGVNTQIDSGFARALATWNTRTGSITTAAVEFNRTGYTGKRSVACIYATGTIAADKYIDVTGLGSWAGLGVTPMRRYSLPVKTGEIIGARILAGHHRSNPQLFILVFDKDGTLVMAPQTASGSISGGGANGDNLGAMSLVITATHADAAYAQLMVRMTGNAENNPLLFFSEPWFGKLASATTPMPAYSPGPADPLGDQTGANTASGISGQGALATLNALQNGGSYLLGFGALSSVNYAVFGNGTILDQGGSTATDSGFKTSLGTASAISGQGGLATKNQAAWRTDFAGAPNYVTDPYVDQSGGGVQAGYVFHGNGQNVRNMFDFFPTTTGSDKTSGGTAAAIASQGAFATQSYIGRTNVATYFNYSAFSLNYSITRQDGSTIVTEALSITSLGIASGISGQGKGATSNNLSDLDKGAADQLAAVSTAGVSLTVKIIDGQSQIITRRVAAGAITALLGNLYLNTPAASGSGTFKVQVNTGSGWVDVQSNTVNYTINEPTSSRISVNYTNNTGVERTFDFRAISSVAPDTNSPRSFFIA